LSALTGRNLPKAPAEPIPPAPLPWGGRPSLEHIQKTEISDSAMRETRLVDQASGERRLALPRGARTVACAILRLGGAITSAALSPRASSQPGSPSKLPIPPMTLSRAAPAYKQQPRERIGPARRQPSGWRTAARHRAKAERAGPNCAGPRCAESGAAPQPFKAAIQSHCATVKPLARVPPPQPGRRPGPRCRPNPPGAAQDTDQRDHRPRAWPRRLGPASLALPSAADPVRKALPPLLLNAAVARLRVPSV